MPHKVRLFLALTFLGSFFTCGQEGYFRGELVDNTTGAPVVFATIRLKERALGVISNQDGGFRVPKRFSTFGEVLTISCLGYKQQEIDFSELNPTAIHTIKMEPQALELEEAVLLGKRKKLSPRKIVKKALERILQNYPTAPFSYVGYYRDYQMKENEYVNLNEALLQITDMGFEKNDFDHTLIHLYEYRSNPDFKRYPNAYSPYDYRTESKIIPNAFIADFDGNELNILRIHDAIRNYDIRTYSYVNRLNKDLIKNHSLSRERDQILGNERMYVISFEKNKPDLDADLLPGEVKYAEFQAEGKLYISQSSYAIHKMVYALFDTSAKVEGHRSKSLAKGRPIFEVTVEYIEANGKMYPNYISFQNVFNLRKSLFHVEDIVIDQEEKCFVIKFNAPPILLIDQDRKNFTIKYKGRKVPLNKIRATADSYYLYPNPQQFDSIWDEVRATHAEAEFFSPEIFEFDFLGISDVQGNELNDFRYEEFQQYREFFTQQIPNLNTVTIGEEGAMNKNRPIFDGQPVYTPDNFDNYWMNTPLKKNQ